MYASVLRNPKPLERRGDHAGHDARPLRTQCRRTRTRDVRSTAVMANKSRISVRLTMTTGCSLTWRVFFLFPSSFPTTPTATCVHVKIGLASHFRQFPQLITSAFVKQCRVYQNSILLRLPNADKTDTERLYRLYNNTSNFPVKTISRALPETPLRGGREGSMAMSTRGGVNDTTCGCWVFFEKHSVF